METTMETRQIIRSAFRDLMRIPADSGKMLIHLLMHIIIVILAGLAAVYYDNNFILLTLPSAGFIIIIVGHFLFYLAIVAFIYICTFIEKRE